MNNVEATVRQLLETADVKIGGNRPQDIHVRNPAFYDRVMADGSLGLGESYMEGYWEANALDVFIEHVLRAKLDTKVRWNRQAILAYLLAKLSNQQTKERSKRVAREHYDLKDILPEPLLDPYNQYTCAYFRDTEVLNEAQERKLRLICEKLQLKREDKVLDIGCGWGGFAKFAAKNYGCHVTGISISDEQIAYARKACEGLPVDILHCDYRDLKGTFDKILTCGMLEHVGYKNYKQFFRIVHSLLSDCGLFLLHTIGNNIPVATTEAFISKYIFPGGMLPALSQLEKARSGLFTLQDMQNLAIHYSKTLKVWQDNLRASWSELGKHYDERFKRMFEYYLLSSKGAFDAGEIQLWQLVFSKIGWVMDYCGAR